MERSDAIKCPSVGYQLAGSKAIQAALSGPNVLEAFCSRCSFHKDTQAVAETIRQSFVQQYKLGGDDLQPEKGQLSINI